MCDERDGLEAPPGWSAPSDWAGNGLAVYDAPWIERPHSRDDMLFPGSSLYRDPLYEDGDS